MAELVTMPKLGFDMAEGTLVRWVKAEGEEVNKGDVIAEIETDKATVEVDSSQSGVMLRHLAEEGTALPVNEPIAVIGEEGEELSDEELESLVGGKVEKEPEEEQPEEEQPEEEEPEEEKEPAGAEQEEQEAEEEQPEVSPAGDVRSSPLARRMAEEHEIELEKVKGSGPQGRIVKKDIEEYLETMQEEAPEAEAPEKEAEVARKAEVPGPAFTLGEIPEDEVVEMSRLRQAIGRRMQDSNQNFPHFFVTRAYKTGEMMTLRKELNELLPESDKISVNDFIVKAVALALRQYPKLNATLEDKEHLHIQGHVNVGVAVAVEGGLMTVVCKDADQKPLRLIAREVREMAERAREGKVKNDDIQGSTFSISNLGMYGVDNFSAIINPPEAGILAVSAVQNVPVVEDGELKVGSRMKATLSADHRVTDGAEAAEFMGVLADYLEKPKRLLL